MGSGGWHSYGLVKQSEMFLAASDFVGRLDEGEIGVVWHHRLREGGELHALATKLDDLPDNPVHGTFTAVEHGAHLHGGSLDDGHGVYPFGRMVRRRYARCGGAEVNPLHHGVADTLDGRRDERRLHFCASNCARAAHSPSAL